MLDLQKASILKRISAYLLDMILFLILVTFIGALSAQVLHYEDRSTAYRALYQKYYDQYGINPNITEDEYSLLTEEEKSAYEFAEDAIRSDEDILHSELQLFTLFLVITAISIFSTYLILEFLIPFFLHNGQTVGKKVFGIGLMRIDGVKISSFQLFVRTVIGKCVIETMVPLLLLSMLVMGLIGVTALIVIGLFAILQLVLFFASKTNSPIHDNLAVTVAVDLSSQVIFENAEELLEAKKKIAAEKTQESPY